ncbi:hypothetical protein METBIDRAFT_11643 [Metschnikowia bicuspidata var. bicuspidata NRRL YB-4993]|uniref:Uncharacterized protein n=1 Tax=Metschnikowia bicuspidata var. bicuspidata NRRL YB-4993 TaxID=869754 RepID=A0A1A0HAA8_9ASCO|nr:hypothetical protein METBIDRAFT_11643 [Metschnikowia bicuspidata var. bicuspidata NRRL YB-4993]OBA21064.1 hypothetical protein METBIDRAFT_11643 [Metschnikowia bicuspidata var. bicuspidata NRRL YB-4993]
MYTFSAPQNFVDNTDLDIESEWNTQYVLSASEASSPLSHVHEPASPSPEFLYECSFCMTAHLPAAPCEEEHAYTLQLPLNASYSYQRPIFVPEQPLLSTFLESNYRKWLVSVTPR